MSYPKQYRITLKDQLDWTYSKDYTVTTVKRIMPLGFANVYDPHTKAYAKREKTQNTWAYGINRLDENGKVWTIGRHWELHPDFAVYENNTRPNQKLIEHDEIVPEFLQHIIVANIPMEGFKIQRSVSRYSTSNKLWRILDPRGFELEITTGTMEDLILGGEIKNGLIVGPCIWSTAKQLVRVE